MKTASLIHKLINLTYIQGLITTVLIFISSPIIIGKDFRFELNKQCQFPLIGDEIDRIQVSGIEPGDAGDAVIWDFRDVEVVNNNRSVSYSNEDSILCALDGLTTYYYQSRGDTLYWCGYENSLTLMVDSIAAIAMVYPMVYGDSISKRFYLKGLYCMRKQIASTGQTTIVADSYGMIYMPEGDTLHNVLRVKRINDSFVRITRHDDYSAIDVSADSLLRLVDVTYNWYAEGYRYPIAESHCYTYFQNGEILSEIASAYLCPPSEQQFIGIDEDNMMIRAQSRTTNNAAPDQTSDYKPSPSLFDELEISQSKEKLMISTTRDYNHTIGYILTDVQGIVYSSGDCQSPGITEVDISRLPLGDYILSVGVGEGHIIYKFTMKH